MIDVTFSYRPREIDRWVKLNQFEPVEQWLVLMGLAVCIMPSLLLAFWLQFFALSLIFSLLTALFLFFAVKAYWFPTRTAIQEFQRQRIYSPESRYEKVSHSEFETRWEMFSHQFETDEEIVLSFASQRKLEPKRLFDESQLELLRGYFQSIGNRQALESDRQPVSLYQQVITDVIPEWVAQFQYREQDLRDAIESVQQPIAMDGSPVEPSKPTQKPSWASCLWLFLILVVFGPMLIGPMLFDLFSERSVIDTGNMILGGGIVLTPFILIWSFYRFLRARTMESIPELPADEYQFGMTPNGWMVGSIDSISFYDWRDVRGFYENEHAWIMECLGQRILLPKRIFADPNQDRFPQVLRAAIRLSQAAHRREQSRDATPIVGEETGNPFQAPGG